MNQCDKKSENRPKLAGSNNSEKERDGMESALCALRDSFHSAAQRPDDFWAKQRIQIKAQMPHPDVKNWWRPASAWGSAAIIVLLCITLFNESSEIPAVGFAAGYDQNLLIEVEQALNKTCPDALAPARIQDQELDGTNILSRKPHFWK